MQNEYSLLELMDTPVFWIDQQGLVQWFNHAVKESIIPIPESTVWTDVVNQLPQGYIYRLHECLLHDQIGMLVECVPDTQPEMLAQLNRLKAANDELELIFNASFDEMFVTDGQGLTLRVNEAAKRLYGLTGQELIGRSVLDLEKERIFYPSASSIVLRSKKQATILQWTKEGRQLVVTANPVFDDQGNIIRIISNAKDVSEMPAAYDHKQVATRNDLNHPLHPSAENEPRSLVAASPTMQETVHLVRKVAATDVTVLLLGETGVGKNRIVRLIHQFSRRAHGPFMEINCAAIPETLLESELFGYERGAFTGANREGKPGKVELAKGGTLFLNEIAELPLNLQGKLLDLLQERTISRVGGSQTHKVDLRIVAATNKDLEKMVENSQFREDLYYRLNVVPITIPALRWRKEDIEPIANAWLQHCATKHGGVRKTLHPQTIDVFTVYPWPGNIRELENTLERLSITLDEDVIRVEHLPERMISAHWQADCSTATKKPQKETAGVFAPQSLAEQERPDRFPTSAPAILAQVEKGLYAEALEQCNSTYAIAQFLQVSQPTVVRKLQQYGLTARMQHVRELKR